MLFVLKPDPTNRVGRRFSSNPTETSLTLDTRPCVTDQSQVGVSVASFARIGRRRSGWCGLHSATDGVKLIR